MAFNKKTWEDNVSDLTAAELNRMEQGIYDNSLVVDAIKDKLNPTDTEAYKTAELTEGQITDAIGVNDILIKGQTSQDGEPTPSSPVDVNVVSGSNIINISGYNLANFKKLENADIINGTATYSSESTIRFYFDEIKLKAGNYCFYFNPQNKGTASSPNLVSLDNTITYGKMNFNSTGYSYCDFTLAEDVILSGFRTYLPQRFAGVISEISLIKGTHQNISNYENYQGKELPLDLPVENLFDKNNYEAGKCYSNNQITANTPWGIYYLPCNSGETYIISELKTYSNTQIVQCNSNKQFILNLVTRSAENTEYTITATQNGYIGISFVWSDSASKGSELDTINIKKAGTDPIELCKIGNYQDYFYKSGSKWYLHKEIEKLTGNDIISTSTFTESSTYSDSTYLCCYNNGFQNATYLNTRAYCNKFDGQYHYGENKVANNIRMGGSSLGICVLKSDFATVNDLNSYFNTSGNDIFVYIVLKTPTNTEITNTTLISQLNAIINSPLYEDTNITQTNSDLPMILDITAYKDNIEGIKAFIRK